MSWCLWKLSVVMFAFPSLLGCGGPLGSDVNTRLSQSKSGIIVLDAGVVFSGEPHMICLPLPADVIRNASNARSLRSSCDCAKIELIDFVDVFGGQRCALLMQFAAELRDPQELLLELGIDLNDGQYVDANVCVVFAHASDVTAKALRVPTSEIRAGTLTPVADLEFSGKGN